MKFSNLLKIFIFTFLSIITLSSAAQVWNVNSDQWTATDELGRKLITAEEAGHQEGQKYLGMFYWTWHTDGLATFPLLDITQILEQYPEAASDANHPAWRGIEGGVFWWDEPLFGYYRTTDEWVLRKHAEMLADAGVDVVFFDCTNGTFTWKTSYTVLLKVWDQARKDGVKTPQIAFLLPFAANQNSLIQMNELYSDLYKPGLYEDLWFMWKGKPLIMAYPGSLVPSQGNTAALKFKATGTFYAINATCPSWGDNIGNITMKLYSWNTNYATSVSGSPLAEKTFSNFNDNEKIRLTFDPLPAGDYIWVLSNGTDAVGVWKWTDSKDDATSYYNGEVVSGNYESEISYNQQYVFTRLTNGTNHTPVEVTYSISQQVVNEIKSFFTFRPGQPDYVNGPSRNDQWGWLEVHPQHGYGPKPGGGFEQATVGVAQNASDASGGHAAAFNNPLSYGRSFTKSEGQDVRPNAYFQGKNFQEQWNRGLEIDPDLIFVTGWNEWTAGRWFDWDVKPFSFVDQYSAEKSRDIEPAKSWGNKGDVYYMQLINNVRKFKGMERKDTISASKTIDLQDPSAWINVKPEYRSYKGNTLHRNHRGQGAVMVYTNNTGRNDIILSKVARDSNYLYFYVQTADTLTDKTDPKWMRLFIDIDRNKETGWEGYDFLLNRTSPGDSVLVEKSTSSWSWEKTGMAGYITDTSTLVIKIHRSTLGLSPAEGLNFEFKWSDNMQDEGNIMDFYVNGDAAPGGRFNYLYHVEWADDDYRYPEFPVKINPGLLCEKYLGGFDSIPNFYEHKISSTSFLETFALQESDTSDFGLRYTGFIDVPEKDLYTFYLNTDHKARLYIGNTLVLQVEDTPGEQAGSIKLMPGKHTIVVEYISQPEITPLLEVQISANSIPKTSIPVSMLYTYNKPPSVSISFLQTQKYYLPTDSVITVTMSDPDGEIEKIEIFDNEEPVNEDSYSEFTIANFEPGNHSVYVRVTDNNEDISESNLLNFQVSTPLAIPGTIRAEEYIKGKGVVLLNSTDTDGGLNAKIAYGWIEYPVEVTSPAIYRMTLRVPASNSSKEISFKIDNVEAAKIEIGNTGTEQTWYDVNTEIYLEQGIHMLQFSAQTQFVIHRIEFNYPGTGIPELKPALNELVTIHPNPSDEFFSIKAYTPIKQVEIVNLVGKVVQKKELGADVYKTMIGNDLQKGMYVMVVTGTDGSRATFKIIKK